MTITSFEVYVKKQDFKFHAAHFVGELCFISWRRTYWFHQIGLIFSVFCTFVAFKGYRERLHGHNYTVGVRLLGSRKIANDGYVVDFGNIKKVTRKICKGLNEHFLVPTLSDVMDISVSEENGYKSVRLSCQDGSYFIFPQSDCAMLPIVHATTEELGIYL